MLWLLILLVIIVVLWWYFKPVWAPKPDKVQAEVEKSFRLAADKAGKMYEGVSGKLKLRRDKSGLAKKFKEWVAEASLDKQSHLYEELPHAAESFAAWLASLTPQETEAFCDKVARFCASLGFDLAWLMDDQLNGQPELKRAIEEAVALYSIAAWRASNVQNDVHAFLAFQQWLANPSRNKALGQKLYGELVRQGLVKVSPDLYLAPEKERTAEAVSAVKQVAENKPAVFNKVLDGIVNPKPTAPKAETKATPAKA
ncbi:MAG: hypothetical protein JW953_17060 [Anaerolineae bacterium]|nr:hypothetical protein [Anaerolineae bacterium]